ncbi:helix-turn-helix domain-containing protein [Myceligenerans pegani]|uniref:Helix-turn-helix domain-containing protein n=1 Tax=Myceligenerans pegani TaxID=2776917 RepID=A0ABR9MUQ2_9MICO|nr:helix-turn-helix domain-containing protein [Myceligenerans sp. TRM 65318]MBE1875112.1 helix-turn-helix domain-containing protein [Myceligenerans sp. TRM 65318]MBE3017383.1 helix-turn-helix domain-containing protein [Myceligenerans sp. TRM 65318]
MSATTLKNHIHLVSLSEAADALGISVKTIRRRIADGTIAGYRVGRLIRVDSHEVRDRLAIRIPTIR